MTDAEAADRGYDAFVEFCDIDADGCVVTYADLVRGGVDLTPGAHLTAGDGEGNRCPATVVSVHPRPNRPGRIVLRLDLDRFDAAG